VSFLSLVVRSLHSVENALQEGPAGTQHCRPGHLSRGISSTSSQLKKSNAGAPGAPAGAASEVCGPGPQLGEAARGGRENGCRGGQAEGA